MSEGVSVAISYRFTGVPEDELKNVSYLAGLIGERVNTVFCSLDSERLFQDKGMSVDAIYEFCLEKFRTCNFVVAFVSHKESSTGMEKELKLAQENSIPVYLIIKRGLDFSGLRESAKSVFEFDSIDEIPVIVRSIRFMQS